MANKKNEVFSQKFEKCAKKSGKVIKWQKETLKNLMSRKRSSLVFVVKNTFSPSPLSSYKIKCYAYGASDACARCRQESRILRSFNCLCTA